MELTRKLERLRMQWRHRREERRARRPPPRRDERYQSLPGGDSPRDAASVPPERGREMAD